jgi:hypothetical protein
VARCILVLMAALSVSACASVRTHLAFWRHRDRQPAFAVAPVTRAPKLHEGLWAIGKPKDADLRAWPRCASPFWIGQGFALVVRTRPGDHGASPDHSYRADYRLAAGDPVIAQVGNDGGGQLFLALTDLRRDDNGQLVDALGAAFACPGEPTGRISLSMNDGGCGTAEPGRVRQAAADSLRDPGALTRVAWITSGAPPL